MSSATFTADSLEATAAIARQFAATLRPGDVVALNGELGAGKTTFLRSVVDTLGGDPSQVSSPTFVLLHVYRTPTLDIFHLDAYRTAGPDDLAAIGFDELLDAGGIVAVEWAEKIRDLLPAGRTEVTLEHLGELRRQITIGTSTV